MDPPSAPRDEPHAVVAGDGAAPLPDLGGPHSEAERLLKNASPGRFAARLVLAVLVLGGAALGVWVGRDAWHARLARHAPMAHVPAATVRIGNAAGPPDEQPEHEVALGAYEIDVTEVTVGAYAACVREARCKPPLKGDFCNWAKEGLDDHPINCVDHEQAAAYCDWAGKRLPTEPEWEHAARGSDRRRFPWGDARPTAAHLNACGSECRLYGAKRGLVWPAMYDLDDGFPLTAPVGSFPEGRSPFGLHDMEGNVREWTASPYCPYPAASCGNELEYVIRGAGWSNHFAMNVEVTTREAIGKAEALEQLGFRCAR